MLGRELALDSFHALTEGLNNVGHALQICGRAIKDVSILCSRFTRDTARFSYNLAGQTTFPIEQELTHTVPPTLSDLNPLGIAVLTLPVPLTIASCLLSVSVIPLIGNSIQSLSRTFVSLTNLALDPEDAIEETGLGEDQRIIVRHVYGSPGLVVGASLGIISLAAIGAGRVVSNTPRSLGRAYARTTNLFLQHEDEIKIDEQDDRSIARQILGSPGLLVGGLFGFISGYIASSAISFGRAFTRVMHLALDEQDEIIKLGEDKRHLAAKISTGPAWFMGGTLGGIAAGFVGFGRIITNIPRSLGRGFAGTCNLFMQKEDEIKIDEQDDRSIARQILGSPGLLVGGLFGFISGYIASSAISLGRAFIRVMNLALDKEDERELGEDKRHLAAKISTGPAWFMGGTLGGMAAGFVGFGRIITNIPRSLVRGFAHAYNLFIQKEDELQFTEKDDRSIARQILGSPGLLVGGLFGFISGYIASSAISFGRAFIRVMNLTLDKEDERTLGEDKRHLAAKISTGPAWFMGGTLGGIAAAAVGFGRIISNIPRSLGRGFAHACNLFLQKNDGIKIDEQDDRSIARQILGSPGLLVGGLFGFISGYIASSAISLGRAFIRVMNLTLDKEDELNLGEDNRHLAAKISTGPAWFIGGSLGGIAAGFVGFGRIISNILRSLGRGFAHKCNLFLQKNDEIMVAEKDDRSIARQILGSPGLLVGGLFGFISGYIASSTISLGRAFIRVMNLALDKEDERALGEDNRHLAAKISTGPAWFMGGTLGGTAAAAVGFGRIISNIPRSLGRGFAHACNLFLQKNDEIKIDEQDDRSIARQILGSPGLLVGGLFGFISGYIASSAISLGRAFIRVMNLTLDKEDERNLGEDNRHLAAKISTGPAWFIGGTLGGIAASCVGAVRIANQSRLSFQALSGSFINGAANRSWFDGLGGDHRSPAQKAVGALGYIAACVTTLPVAMTGWTLTKAVPTLGSLTLGTLFSPVIMIGKLIAKCCSADRFPAQQNEGVADEATIERGLKNIFSSLNTFGRLSPGATVETVGDGEEKAGSFIRKCFTFNANSVTEKTLNILLTHYRHYANGHDDAGAGFFTDRQAYNAAIEETKDYYRSGCCESTEAVKEALQEIENIAGFVQDYMQKYIGSVMTPTIPEGLYDVRKSWSATFWGNSKRQAASRHASDLTQAQETDPLITGHDKTPAYV